MQALIIGTVIRWLLGLLGAGTGVVGWIDASDLQTVFGALVSLASLIWGIYQKFKVAKEGVPPSR